MKLFRVSIGHTELFAAGIDSEDIYNRRESLDHTFAYLPIVIDEVKVEGYEITVTSTKVDAVNLGGGRIMSVDAYIDLVKTMDKSELKNALHRKSIEFHHALGEDKLRELVIANIVA